MRPEWVVTRVYVFVFMMEEHGREACAGRPLLLGGAQVSCAWTVMEHASLWGQRNVKVTILERGFPSIY